MALSDTTKFQALFLERVHLVQARQAEMRDMPEGLVKDWITELIADNERLEADKSALQEMLGNTAFNPVQW